jgi:hypothetical protein
MGIDQMGVDQMRVDQVGINLIYYAPIKIFWHKKL